jgi:hypothetical protein
MAKDIPTNMLKVTTSGFWNNSFSFSSFSDPDDMDIIIFIHIDENAFSRTRNKKMRTLERLHSLMFDDTPSPPPDMMLAVLLSGQKIFQDLSFFCIGLREELRLSLGLLAAMW